MVLSCLVRDGAETSNKNGSLLQTQGRQSSESHCSLHKTLSSGISASGVQRMIDGLAILEILDPEKSCLYKWGSLDLEWSATNLDHPVKFSTCSHHVLDVGAHSK